MDLAQFRQSFPEFADTTQFPDSTIEIWLTIAVSLVNPTRWMELTDIGVGLVTAHHVALATRNTNAVAVGGVPGQVVAPQASKSVDKVSASYDTSAVTLGSAGFWNSTSYGIQYLTMARMMGAGGIQI
ncbi:bacteriophage protein [Burkholderia aenigmatica]|uniref:Bacteriophage protein n=1 Tax=Burkholderia aenigmatica TaxID=2015348 RepID=A0ABY6XXW7_9BURK|nr:DUF4054 domain-containing protein [Burkholderia aenigmatica]VWD02163.1 bacteriophage protein [Burkholderia aenigmatica]